MIDNLFGSDLWKPALDKYAEATGLTVELFGLDGQVVLGSTHFTPLVALLREFSFEPGLFAECARRCLMQTFIRPVVLVDEQHSLSVIGTALTLQDKIVGAAVAGYALVGFPNVSAVQRWSGSSRLPFHRLWHVVRHLPPVPERRLILHGELLQVLGDALLRENYQTRQHEEAVVQLKAAAAAKDEFLAVLSHELRAPLAPIASWAAVLKKTDSMEHVRAAADSMERNVRLESRMIDDLLDVSRIAHGSISLQPEVLDLPVCVRAAVETIAQEIEKKRIRVDFVDPTEPLFVEGDADRVQQIFRNIFTNAVKFTPAGGSMRVTLAREENNALVVVADTGIGIAPEFLPFVFDIFRQQEQGTRREHEGLGIGLALVKQLTELHWGTVGIASAGTGCGTKVAVRFPLIAEMPDRPDVAADTRPQVSTLTGVSILVVEDSDDTRESMRVLLQHLGATVSVARDGREALETVQEAEPDVVLCDLRMPRMDGYEFLSELRRRPAQGHLPVVAMSGLASEADFRRTREAGFEAHLKKPVDMTAVIVAVDAAVHHRQDRQPGERASDAISPDAPLTTPRTEDGQSRPGRTERRGIPRRRRR